jgi:predicted nucleotidyltransferase
MMLSLVASKQDRLKALCLQFGVKRLELFGSASDGQFDSERSDLDFLVVFDPSAAGSRADRYFGLLEALESLFSRPADLVELEAIRNPYFRESIERSRTLLYAA